MAETAVLLVDEVLPEQPLRQWLLSVPNALCFPFACQPVIMGRVLPIVYCIIPTHVINKADGPWRTVRTGAVTLFRRFGRALNS